MMLMRVLVFYFLRVMATNIEKLEQKIALLKKELSLKRQYVKLKKAIKQRVITVEKIDIRTCYRCKKQYEKTKLTGYKFCSKSCYHKHNNRNWTEKYWKWTGYQKSKKTDKNCIVCKNKFYWHNSMVCCSNKCYHELKYPEVTKLCIVCGTSFKTCKKRVVCCSDACIKKRNSKLVAWYYRERMNKIKTLTPIYQEDKLRAEILQNSWSNIYTPIYEEDKQAAHWYVKCHSCNQYFPWSHPEHWYTMCEDCVW